MLFPKGTSHKNRKVASVIPNHEAKAKVFFHAEVGGRVRVLEPRDCGTCVGDATRPFGCSGRREDRGDLGDGGAGGGRRRSDARLVPEEEVRDGADGCELEGRVR